MEDSIKDEFKKIIEGNNEPAKEKFLKDAIKYDDKKKKEFWKAVLENPGNTKKFWIVFERLSKTEKEELLKTAKILTDQPKGSGFKATWVTYAIGIGLMIANIAVATFYWKEIIEIENTIIFTTFITFFGVLFLSAQHRQTQAAPQEKQASGIMRRSIAATIVLVYLISFAAITFGDFQEKDKLGISSEETITQLNQTLNQILELEDLSESDNLQEEFNQRLEKLKNIRDILKIELDSQQTMLGHFTTVVSVVIAFYFGSKVVEKVASKKNGESDADKIKKLKKGIDDAAVKIDSTPDEAKKDLNELSETLK